MTPVDHLCYLDLTLLRGSFVAGNNVMINSGGTISAAIDNTNAGQAQNNCSIGSLPVVTGIAAGDLVRISQGGTADAITYQNFLNGLTIDEAQPAAAASDSDTTWVAQGSNTMVCQTFSAIWAWIASHQPGTSPLLLR